MQEYEHYLKTNLVVRLAENDFVERNIIAVIHIGIVQKNRVVLLGRIALVIEATDLYGATTRIVAILEDGVSFSVDISKNTSATRHKQL